MNIQSYSKFYPLHQNYLDPPLSADSSFFLEPSPLKYVGCAPDVKKFFLFCSYLILGGRLDVCRPDNLFFALRLISGGDWELFLFALICVGSATTNCLGVRDLKKVENHSSILVTAFTACPFSIKKCAKMSVFYVKTAKICWRRGDTPPDPRLSPPPPPLPNPRCVTALFPQSI